MKPASGLQRKNIFNVFVYSYCTIVYFIHHEMRGWSIFVRKVIVCAMREAEGRRK